MGDELATVHKKTLIYFNNKYLNYPLRPRDIATAMNPLMLLLCFMDFIKNRLVNRKTVLKPSEFSFRNVIVLNFGEMLYERFFGSYARKVWGVDPARLNARWLTRRVSNKSVWVLIKEALLEVFTRKKKQERYSQQPGTYLYARHGARAIASRISEEITKRGGKIISGARIKKIVREGGEVRGVVAEKDGKDIKIDCDYLISSLPLNDLVSYTSPPFREDIVESAKKIRYRAIIVLCLSIKKDHVLAAQWNYYPGTEYIFNRISEFKNVLPDFAPEGKTGIAVEVTCFRGDKIWRMDEKELLEKTLEGLRKLSLVEEDELEGCSIVRLPWGYPLDTLDIRAALQNIFTELKSFRNLRVIGREGLFRYINMDESVKTGFEAAESIIAKEAGS
jgi:protoporphyrinogen oxidase